MIPTFENFRQLGKILIACFIFIFVMIVFLVLYVYSQFNGTAGNFGNIDCVVVFGAAVHGESFSGPGIDRRVSAAADLYKNGSIKRIFMTGGKGNESQDSEAQVMRRTAMLMGVDPEDIIMEENAKSTWENLLYVYPLTQGYGCISPIIGISDKYHLGRIRYIAFLQGIKDFRTLPAGDRPEWKFETWSVLRESLGIIYYFIDSFVKLDGFFAT